ncbi:hypothetical protein ACFL40_03465 [candidate division KSB1 bacterium]
MKIYYKSIIILTLQLIIISHSVTAGENKFSKINNYMDFYLNCGYLHAHSGRLISNKTLTYNDISPLSSYFFNFIFNTIITKRKPLYDITLGTNIKLPVKYTPLFFSFSLNNINTLNGISYKKTYLKDISLTSTLDLNISKPFITLGTGTYKEYSGFTLNAGILYAANIKPNKEYAIENQIIAEYPNKSLSDSHSGTYKVKQKLFAYHISASKNIKKYTAAISAVLYKKNQNYNLPSAIYANEPGTHYNIKRLTLNLGLTMSYNFKYISPYISVISDVYNKSDIERIQGFLKIDSYNSKMKHIYLKAGIQISSSEILRGINTIPVIPGSLKDLYTEY